MRTGLWPIAAWSAGWLALWITVAGVAPRAPAIPDVGLNNAVAVERLRLDGVAGRTVLIGSSVIGQLPVGRLDARALNLGLSGYGAATGIHLVDRAGQLPTIAIIETNELGYEPDSAYADSLLAAPSPRLSSVRATRLEFRPSTQAISGIVRISGMLRRLQDEPGKRMTEQRLAAGWSNVGIDTAGTRRAARWVAARLRGWRARGVRVVLVELPQHGKFRESPYASTQRAIVDAELPPSEFERVGLGARTWRTSDGRHLEADDALDAARAVLAAVPPRS